MKDRVLSASRKTSIATEVSNSDFATAVSPQHTVRSSNSLSEPEADPGSSEDQTVSLLRRRDAEFTSSCIDGQDDIDGLGHHLASPIYSHTDSEPQVSSHLDQTTLPYHQPPHQLPELVLQEYAPIATEQTESGWHNTKYTPQGTHSSYGDRHQLGLPICVLKRNDAELLRHFFSGFSNAFDLGDPDRPFSSWLSTRVLQFPRLLESILMIASRHLGKEDTNTTFLNSEADASSCHAQLLPSIASIIDLTIKETHSVTSLLSRFVRTMEAKNLIYPSSLSQEDMMEELTEPFQQEDLREAAWWANLRLKIYLAVVTQAPFASNSDSAYADKKGVPIDDKEWANLMLLHLADISRYCFSDNKHVDHYTALLTDLTTWSKSKPDSFDPIYTCKHPDGRVLPDVWVYNESVAAGLQYYHLGRMLLISHDPRLPKIGPAKNRAMKRIEMEMKNDTKIICAIAEGMGEASPTYLTACMAIALVGDLFDTRAERDTLTHILTNAADQFGWPTSYIRETLKETWG
ncbi:hypothetical protein FSST1_002725 [Fusarium sambucinum]